MGRKKKTAGLDSKIAQYKADFELDDLNKSNDEASLVQLCKYELEIDKLFDSIKKVDAQHNPKAYKDLMSSARDATNAYNSLLVSLGIARKERVSEADETPLSYIERLRSQAHTILEQRLKRVECHKCNITVMKYHIYVTESGERGALSCEGKQIEPIKYTIQIECPKCGDIVERTQNNR